MRIVLIIYLFFSFNLVFSQEDNKYPVKESLFQLSEDIFISGKINKVKFKGSEKIILFSDTTIARKYSYIAPVRIFTGITTFAGGHVHKKGKAKFSIYLIEDKDSVYRKFMIKEVNAYYANNMDSVEKREYFKSTLDSPFVAKKIVYKSPNLIFPYFTDNKDYYIVSLGNQILKIESEYLGSKKIKRYYKINSVSLYFETREGKLFVFTDAYSERDKRKLYEEGKFK